MKTGEIKVIDQRFVSPGPAASWDEFLVLERLEDGYRLDIKVYGSLSDEIRIEMKFRTREEFVGQVEKLVRASDSEALDELIRIFKNP